MYGQQEVVKDLIEARLADGGAIVFGATDTMPQPSTRTAPIRYKQDGNPHALACDFIVGCDGFHGVSRQAIPPGHLTVFERTYPFAWLGISRRRRPRTTSSSTRITTTASRSTA